MEGNERHLQGFCLEEIAAEKKLSSSWRKQVKDSGSVWREGMQKQYIDEAEEEEARCG